MHTVRTRNNGNRFIEQYKLTIGMCITANRRTWHVYGRADRRTWQTKSYLNDAMETLRCLRSLDAFLSFTAMFF